MTVVLIFCKTWRTILYVYLDWKIKRLLLSLTLLRNVVVRNGNNDLWVLHIAYLPVINEKLEEMKSYFNDHPIRSAGGKTPKQMHALGGLLLQVINTLISPQAVDILHD